MKTDLRKYTERLLALLFLPFALQPAFFSFTKGFNMLFVVYNTLFFLLLLLLMASYLKRGMYKKGLGVSVVLLVIVFVTYYEWVDHHILPEESKTESSEEWKFIFLERKKLFRNLGVCDTLSTSFKYHNDTGENQKIDSVKTSCGCTEVSYPQKIIRPDEKGEVTVSISLTDELGTFSHTLCVFFHNQKPVVLKIIGNIKQDFSVRSDLQSDCSEYKLLCLHQQTQTRR